MLEGFNKFYEAAYAGEEIEKKGKLKFVVVKKVSHLFKNETIEAEVMNQVQYNKADKANHLISFAVDAACKGKLQACIDSKLKDNLFDEENPKEFLSLLEAEGVKIEPKDDFSYILDQRFNTLATLKSEDDTDGLLENIKKTQDWFGVWKQSISEFDKDNEFNNGLIELETKCIELSKSQNGKSSGVKDLTNKLNAIEFLITLKIISYKIELFENLRDKFVGAEPEYNQIQRLIDKFFSELKKVRKNFSEKNPKKIIPQSNELSVSIDEQYDLYEDKKYQIINGLKERFNAVEHQLVELDSVPLPRSKELLSTEELTNLMGIFVKNLKTESLVTLRDQVIHIESVFNANFEAVKNAFVEVSKQRLEILSNFVLPYDDLESAKPILQEVASLQTMLVDFSPNSAAQFGSAIERVNQCVKNAEEFYNYTSEHEGIAKTNLRPASYLITRFFDKEESVLNQIKQHREKIQHGYWRADEKAEILKDISSKVDAIKDKNEKLNQSSTVDGRKVIEIREDFYDLYQFIRSKEEALSRYRGIAALQPLAKLWGGGKVTSEKYVNEIKEELDKINDSGSHLSLYSVN